MRAMLIQRTLAAAAVVLVALICGLALGQPNQADTPLPQLSDEQLQQITDGEILVVSERDGQLHHGTATGRICAPTDELFSIVQQCGEIAEWMPRIKESSVVSERDGQPFVCAGRMDMPWPITDRRWQAENHSYTLERDGQSWQVLAFAYVEDSGNMAAMSGYWMLRPMEDGCTLAHYVLDSDIGVPLPPSLVEDARQELLPGNVRGLAERHQELYGAGAS